MRFHARTQLLAVASLAELIKQDRFASPAHEAMLNVMVTHSWITSALAETMAEQDLTLAQYNVLRILRGAHPEPVPCSYIGSRLIDRTPDVTRLLDRLQRVGLIERQRAEHDRRVVEVGITQKGLERLDRLQEPIENVTTRLLGGLAEEDQRHLSSLLERLRAGAEHRPSGCGDD